MDRISQFQPSISTLTTPSSAARHPLATVTPSSATSSKCSPNRTLSGSLSQKMGRRNGQLIQTLSTFKCLQLLFQIPLVLYGAHSVCYKRKRKKSKDFHTETSLAFLFCETETGKINLFFFHLQLTIKMLYVNTSAHRCWIVSIGWHKDRSQTVALLLNIDYVYWHSTLRFSSIFSLRQCSE